MTDIGGSGPGNPRRMRRVGPAVLGALLLVSVVAGGVATAASDSTTDATTAVHPTSVEIVNASTPRDVLRPGQTSRTKVKLRNTGEQREVDIWLRKNGEIVKRKTVTVAANSTQTFEIGRRYSETGKHEMTVQLKYQDHGKTVKTDPADAGTVTVTGEKGGPTIPPLAILVVGLGIVAIGGAYYALSEGAGTPEE